MLDFRQKLANHDINRLNCAEVVRLLKIEQQEKAD